jgi:MoxR-like ATPase
MEEVIKAAIFTPGKRGWGLPMLYWGLSGVGKSDIIEEIGQRWKMHVEVLSPSERGEGAFGVTPMPRKAVGGGYVTSYPAPDWIENFEDFDGRGIVFLDELTTAAPMIQAAMLGLIQARRIGGATLGSSVRILGAANPPDRAAAGWDLAAPIANRFGHAEWAPPTEREWSDHEMSGNDLEDEKPQRNDPAAEEARVLAAWPTARANAVGLITSFHIRNPGKLHAQPDVGNPQGGRAWASHRSWSNAVRAMASAKVHGLSDADSVALISGFVGEGATRELLVFQAQMDLPDPADVLDGKVQWEHDDSRLDRSMAVLNSIVSLAVGSDTNRATRLPRLWSIIDKTPADDIIAMSIKPLSRARLTTHPSAVPVLARIRPMLKAAGIAV